MRALHRIDVGAVRLGGPDALHWPPQRACPRRPLAVPQHRRHWHVLPVAGLARAAHEQSYYSDKRRSVQHV